MDVDAPAATAAVPIRGPAEVPVVLTVNGRDYVLELVLRVSKSTRPCASTCS